MAAPLTQRQQQVLDFIVEYQNEHGYPPSVREIGTRLGLRSPATVKSHLDKLRDGGYLRRDAIKPRAIEVLYDPVSGLTADRGAVRHVPLVGDVAAGTDVIAQENVEELLPVPVALTGEGELFMLRVRGDSMIQAGIHDGDYVVCRVQPTAEPGDIVVAGIPGEEATVKIFRPRGATVVLEPANPTMEPLEFPADEVRVYGRVVTVMRRL
ncbi:MAG: transcriptional repressor LexA [Actinomyces sp.]|nr:MAG: transcriptional repressor LexA [Actinomyces sp.]